jgi:hypothetical protein
LFFRHYSIQNSQAVEVAVILPLPIKLGQIYITISLCPLKEHGIFWQYFYSEVLNLFLLAIVQVHRSLSVLFLELRLLAGLGILFDSQIDTNRDHYD